jgi:hypothetical protein
MAVVVATNALACSGGLTSPSLTASTARFQVSCAASVIFVGQIDVCAAVAYLTNGLPQVVSATGAVWSSSNPAIASFQVTNGPVVTGLSAGQVTISATYQGVSGTTQLSVQAQDFVQATSYATQGAYKIGSTLTVTQEGCYGVASADSGQLTIVITDQNGAVIGSSAPQTKSRGGGSFVIPATFVIPAGTTQFCRGATLQVGGTTVMASGGCTAVTS